MPPITTRVAARTTNTDTNQHKDKEQWKGDQYLINSTICKRNVVDIDCETNGASDD